ncbi:MAG: hypothetical protein U5N26_12410 [Candidatus Marinimicrobia bacterium]|nr:hypothetical protein [Candidatus Neomarinimicrobiota bacterium]
MMKKITIALLFVTVIAMSFVGCDGILDPDRLGEPEFSPPAWIIGTWADTLGKYEYVFEENDITLNDTYDLKEMFRGASMDEEMSSESYAVTFSFLAVDTTVFRFDKTSSTTLEHSVISMGDTSALDTDILGFTTKGSIELIKQ